MDYVHVVTYRTESGDEGVVGVWNIQPSEDEVLNILRDRMPDEFSDDPEDEYCLVYPEFHLVEDYR